VQATATGGIALPSSPTARVIDSEIGDLRDDLLASSPLLTCLRYDLALRADAISPLEAGLSQKRIESLGATDEPDNLETLKELGELAAARQVRDEDFPRHFDLAS